MVDPGTHFTPSARNVGSHKTVLHTPVLFYVEQLVQVPFTTGIYLQSLQI